MRGTTCGGASLALLLTTFATFGADPVYSIRDGGFAVHNGGAYFNRPLAGTADPSMLLSGDQPEFVYIAPTDTGKMGNLRIGVVSERGGTWLDEAASVDFLYQPGWTRHTVSDPAFVGGVLEVGAVPLAAAEGFQVRLRWTTAPSADVKLVWQFGGASGAGKDFRMPPLDKLHLSGADFAGNTVRTDGGGFDLTAPSLKDRHLYGRCDLAGTLAARPAISKPGEAAAASQQAGAAAVFVGDWPRERKDVHFTAVSRRTAPEFAFWAEPARTFEESLKHYRGIARRAWLKTPDARFDLAFESMVIANDAIWQPPAFTHGAVSWMIPYLGWRVWYGPDALGWHERVGAAIRAFAALQIQRGDARGGIPDRLASRGVFYNMNEVYLDHIYHHYAWTGDRALLASLYPVIAGVLAWEKQHLDPDSNGLYESCLNTWISDSHWYSGGDTTQATAYMYRAHLLGAEAAEAAGADPAPYRAEALRIRSALNEKLWLPDRGHYAEYIDRIGLRRLHPEPELPTIYHPIEFGLTDEFQAYQMLRFTETTLRNERDLPFGGRMAWSSRWAPNHNRGYVHSTHELAFAEEMNLAFAYYRAGQAEAAYDLVKGTYAPMYMGSVPGGMPCHAYSNGVQRLNEEFADGISMFAKVAVEGVFGIVPEMQRGVIHITPGFPREWNEAAIHTPDVSYTYRAAPGQIEIDVTSEREAVMNFRVPLEDAASAQARINGRAASGKLTAGIGTTWFEVTGGTAKRTHLDVTWTKRVAEVSHPEVIAQGETLLAKMKNAAILEVKDPQRVLAGDGRTIQPVTGYKTLFIRYGDAQASQWKAVNIEVRPRAEILDALATPAGQCQYSVRNNTSSDMRARATVACAGVKVEQTSDIPARAERTYTLPAADQLLPGTHRVSIQGLPGTGTIWKELHVWEAGTLDARWRPVSLESHFNDTLATVLHRKFWTSEIPYAVSRDYLIDHLNMFGIRQRIPDDKLLRAAVDDRGMLRTSYGIPFAQKKSGPNIVALSRWPELSSRLVIPVNATARRLYVLESALTFPMQSHIANARIRVNYSDGGHRDLDLENPRNFDNGLGLFGGTYHYSNHGVVWLSDEQYFAGKSTPATLLEQHEAWKAVWQDFSKVETRPHADIVDVPLDAGRTVRDVEIEVLSQDIILAVFGVTLADCGRDSEQ